MNRFNTIIDAVIDRITATASSAVAYIHELWLWALTMHAIVALIPGTVRHNDE